MAADCQIMSPVSDSENASFSADAIVSARARKASTAVFSTALRAVPAGDRVLLAVGPEGGWDEPDELDSLARHGFERVTLGERTLRTDVAVVSLLAIANEHLAPP